MESDSAGVVLGGEPNGKEPLCPFRIKMNYRLCAVIEHIGNPYGGHYISAKKTSAAQGNKWILCDDINTQEISEAVVMNSIAYMLFYEKIE